MKRISDECVQSMLSEVCLYFSVDVDILLSRTRKRHVVTVRQVLSRIMTDVFKMSLHTVAAILKRDHATVLISRNVCRDLCDVECDYASDYQKCVELCLNVYYAIYKEKFFPALGAKKKSARGAISQLQRVVSVC